MDTAGAFADDPYMQVEEYWDACANRCSQAPCAGCGIDRWLDHSTLSIHLVGISQDQLHGGGRTL